MYARQAGARSRRRDRALPYRVNNNNLFFSFCFAFLDPEDQVTNYGMAYGIDLEKRAKLTTAVIFLTFFLEFFFSFF